MSVQIGVKTTTTIGVKAWCRFQANFVRSGGQNSNADQS